jgi:hypothetical protein
MRRRIHLDDRGIGRDGRPAHRRVDRRRKSAQDEAGQAASRRGLPHGGQEVEKQRHLRDRGQLDAGDRAAGDRLNVQQQQMQPFAGQLVVQSVGRNWPRVDRGAKEARVFVRPARRHRPASPGAEVAAIFAPREAAIDEAMRRQRFLQASIEGDEIGRRPVGTEQRIGRPRPQR